MITTQIKRELIWTGIAAIIRVNSSPFFDKAGLIPNQGRSHWQEWQQKFVLIHRCSYRQACFGSS